MGPGTPEGGAPRKWARRRRARRFPPDGGAGAGPTLREALLALLERMGGTPERAGLQRLWDNWEAALGPDLAALAQPLGHHAEKGATDRKGRRVTLLLAAEDAMLLQELRFRGDEILERVNVFLGRPYFSEVKVSLPLGRSAPVRSRERAARPEQGETGGGPAARGVFLADMDGDSPVARCYARFARRSGEGAATAGGKPEEYREK